MTGTALTTTVDTVKVLLTKIEQSRGKTEQLEITVGLHLKGMKDSKPSGITWPEYLKKYFDDGLAQSRANELISIAEGRTTVAKVREKTTTRMRVSREKSPARAGEPKEPQPKAEPEPVKEDEPAGDNAQVVWRRGLVARAEQAGEDATFESWNEFEVDAKLVRIVEQAARAWAKLAAHIRGKLK